MSTVKIGGKDTGHTLAWHLEQSPAQLAHADLRDRDLSGADLRGADLEYADLTGARLRGADLSGANLTLATLENADLTDARTAGARLDRAFVRGAALPDTDEVRQHARRRREDKLGCLIGAVFVFTVLLIPGTFVAIKDMKGDPLGDRVLFAVGGAVAMPLLFALIGLAFFLLDATGRLALGGLRWLWRRARRR